MSWPKRAHLHSCACFCLLYFGEGETCQCVSSYRNSRLLPPPTELKCSFLADSHKLHIVILINFIYCLETFKLGILVAVKAAFHHSCTQHQELSGCPLGLAQDSWTCRSDVQRAGLRGGDPGLGYLKWVGDVDHPVLWTGCFEWRVCGVVISESQMEWI